MFFVKHRTRIQLRPALTKYWAYLIGIVSFPFLLLAVEFLALPDVVLLPLFFVCVIPASWPWLAKDAPYSFWIVAMALWLLVPLTMLIISSLVQGRT